MLFCSESPPFPWTRQALTSAIGSLPHKATSNPDKSVDRLLPFRFQKSAGWILTYTKAIWPPIRSLGSAYNAKIGTLEAISLRRACGGSWQTNTEKICGFSDFLALKFNKLNFSTLYKTKVFIKIVFEIISSYNTSKSNLLSDVIFSRGLLFSILVAISAPSIFTIFYVILKFVGWLPSLGITASRILWSYNYYELNTTRSILRFDKHKRTCLFRYV